MLKGLIFDFDGLMIDTEYTWYPIYKDYLMDQHNYELKMEDFLTAIGSNDDYLMSVLQKEIGDDFDLAHFNTVKSVEFDTISNTLPMMDGVHDLLLGAKEAGIKLAIATSSQHPHAYNHLKRWGIDDLFEVIITGSDVDEVKPAPDLFLKALSSLNLDAAHVFVIEDSYNGLLAANTANIDCIIVPNEVTKYSEFKTHTHKLNSLDEISIEDLKGYKK